MKAVAIVLLSAIAMASAQGVNVVDNNPGAGQVNVVEQPGGPVKTVGSTIQDVDPGFGLPSAGAGETVITNPDPAYYLGSSNNDPCAPPTLIQNPDQGFYLPSSNNNANVAPSIDPTYVDPGFGLPSAGAGETIISNPDPAFYLGSSNNANVAPSLDPTYVDPGFGLPSAGAGETVINNPDPSFYLGNSNNENVAPSIDPTFIVDDTSFYRPSDTQAGDLQPYNRPPKYPNPAARGGK